MRNDAAPIEEPRDSEACPDQTRKPVPGRLRLARRALRRNRLAGIGEAGGEIAERAEIGELARAAAQLAEKIGQCAGVLGIAEIALRRAGRDLVLLAADRRVFGLLVGGIDER